MKLRYAYKLLANVVGVAIGIVSEAIVPRGLGPKAYGDFNFLTNFFIQIVGFFEMGTATGFYTKLSQRPRESELISFYIYFAMAVTLCVIAFLTIAVVSPLHDTLWPGQSIHLIWFAAGFGILTWIVQIMTHIGDAYGLTVSTELGRISQKALGLLLIVLLFLLNMLNIQSFFIYQYVINCFLIAVLVWLIRRNRENLLSGWRLSRDKVRDYLGEFYRYSHPLFSYALAAMIAGVLDRWLLQKYAGSTEQGFYSLSYQIGALCFLFTSALTPLLMREFSIAHGNKDHAKLAELFDRSIILFYSIAAYFSCFIAIQADSVIAIMGGSQYEKAAAAATVMAFYPLHQTYGQLSGSFFFATGRTALYRNVGITCFVLGLPVTYFLIVPASGTSLISGSLALSIKMVAINIISVNVLLWYNTRLLGLSFTKYLWHQVYSFLCLLAIAFVSSRAVAALSPFQGVKGMIFNFILAGICYTILTIIAGYRYPALFGIGRNDMRSFFTQCRQLLSQKAEKE